MLQQLLISCLILTGIHICFWDGMILWRLKKYLCCLPYFIQKPLFDCLICMASVWGTVLYFGYWYNDFSFQWIVFILALAGLNTIASSIIEFAGRVMMHD